MQMGIILLIIYLIFFPVLNGLIQFIKNYFRRSLYGRRSRTALRDEVQKETIADKVKQYIGFVIKEDKRKLNGIPHKLLVVAPILIGAGIAFFSGVSKSWKLFGVSLLIQVVSFVIASSLAKDIIFKREEILNRMVQLKQGRMGLVGDKNDGIEAELKVLKWSDDYTHPLALHIYLPTEFDTFKIQPFLLQFNELFSSEGVWVANMRDEDYTGFDFTKGVASLVVTPPLPDIAMWHEKYIQHPDITWSYFPIALGSENGVPIKDEETGKVERVLGFALNNDQQKHMQKKGIPVGSDMAAAPQVLIAGGTGGGKALAIDTEIEVYSKDDNNE